MQSMVGRFLGFIASFAVVMTLASPANAGYERYRRQPPKSHPAPEIDPAGLGAIASLLVGGTLLMKARRGTRVA